MALNIKDPTTEALVADVARLTGETKTMAVRVALDERRARLESKRGHSSQQARRSRFLEHEVWPQIAPDGPNEAIPQDEQDALLGYGDEGP